MEKKRKLSYRYRLANIRKKRWKEDRDHMESIRLRAISKAKFNKDIHSVRLADFISLWPETLTTQQLNDNINAQINLTNSTLKSFKEYLTRRKILRYDAVLGKWINLILLQLPEIN